VCNVNPGSRLGGDFAKKKGHKKKKGPTMIEVKKKSTIALSADVFACLGSRDKNCKRGGGRGQKKKKKKKKKKFQATVFAAQILSTDEDLKIGKVGEKNGEGKKPLRQDTWPEWGGGGEGEENKVFFVQNETWRTCATIEPFNQTGKKGAGQKGGE